MTPKNDSKYRDVAPLTEELSFGVSFFLILRFLSI